MRLATVNERGQGLLWVTVPAGMPVFLVPLLLRGILAWSQIILHCLTFSFVFLLRSWADRKASPVPSVLSRVS